MATSPQKRATRKYYAWEQRIKLPDRLLVGRPLRSLKRMANHIWRVEMPKSKGILIWRARVDSSYSQKPDHECRRYRICFRADQTTYGVLLHEIAHLLTDDRALWHGTAFRRNFKYLVAEYGGVLL